MPRYADARTVVLQHEGLLIDAYGVLVTSGGPIPGAPEFVSWLHREGVPFVVVTNDASRLPETSSARYAALGVNVPADRIVTSGSLLEGYFADNGLRGEPTVVLGPADSREYVVRAGGRLVDFDSDASVLVLADESGFPFLEAIDAALTTIVRRVESGDAVRIVVPNPDLTYPKGGGGLGVASGAVAALLRVGLESRLGEHTPAFDYLGKPHRPIFERGLDVLGTMNALMIGDQVATDIAGAAAAGLPSALVETGVGKSDPQDVQPDWVFRSLSPAR